MGSIPTWENDLFSFLRYSETRTGLFNAYSICSHCGAGAQASAIYATIVSSIITHYSTFRRILDALGTEILQWERSNLTLGSCNPFALLPC